jgi:alkylation response protein AidB-like acyl-CoA dehydrogenase
VDFAFSQEQEELRLTVRQFLADRSPEAEVRRWMDVDPGYDSVLWKQMAAQLGLQSLAIPEQYGGAGYGFLELAVVFEEMGRALLPSPYLATVGLAVNALLATGDEAACARLLPAIAAGDLVATLAVTESDGSWAADAVRTTATQTADGWRITGTKDFVLSGASADVILVAARTDAGISLFAVEGNIDGLRRERLSTLDQTRPLARLTLDGVAGELVGTDGAGWPAIERALDVASVALACEQVGGAQRCLDMAVEYAKTRIQFGRPIGSFQAVKHKCADLLVDVESAKSAAYYAAWCAAELNDELPAMASLARAFCSEVFTKAAADNIQVHGGIGFTWEHPAHLYLKRAKSAEILFGDPALHRARLADLLGI